MLELHLLDVELDVEALDLLGVRFVVLVRELLEADVLSSISPISSVMFGSEEHDASPSFRRSRGGDRRRTTSSPLCAHARGRRSEMTSLMSGTVTFAGCFVGSRTMPIWSGRDRALPCERVDRRDAVARQRADLDAEVRAQPRLLLRADLAADVLAVALATSEPARPRTRCRSTPRPWTSRRASDTVTLVISAP